MFRWTDRAMSFLSVIFQFPGHYGGFSRREPDKFYLPHKRVFRAQGLKLYSVEGYSQVFFAVGP